MTHSRTVRTQLLMLAAAVALPLLALLAYEIVRRQRGLPLAVVAVLLAVGLALIVGRSIARPLRAVRDALDRVAAGEPGARLPETGPAEIAALAREVNRLLDAGALAERGRHEAEERLRAAEQGLREADAERAAARAREAQEADRRRRERMAQVGTLVAAVAHEVRNPLFGITASLDAFEAKHGAAGGFREFLDALRGEVARLNRLMKGLLDYGRPARLERTTWPLGPAVAEAAQSCVGLAAATGVTIENRVHAGLLPVVADRRQMVQALQHLVDNAVRHSPPAGVVAVEARLEESDGRRWIVAEIADRGPGFQPEDLERAFEPFYSRRTSATGLGLSIVRRIVEDHGGVAVARNRPEGGATIELRLPVV